ncbi:MAG: glutathione transport system ATP-binding protein, partial [Actinomycetota bacterium]|nr:glutathione transport system ATP-binding protein [Actinomycetota bacterium]
MTAEGDVPVAEMESDLAPAAADLPPGAVLSVRNLSVEFPSDDGPVHAVDDVSFDVFENEVLGIVGESGSGKSVTSMAIMGLLPRTAKITGDVYFRGRSIAGLPDKEFRKLRGDKIAMVFQDALTALNPVYTVGHQIAEAIEVHRDLEKHEVRERVVELLALVGIPNPADRVDQYPHEYSGGMRQRAMIAMSIANEPDVLIADEPTTALDVTIQAQVLEVLERIQDRTKSAILLITHDLGVVAGVAHRVMVMYAGRQAELGSVDEVFYDSRHPYTLSLLAALPRLDLEGGGPRLYRIKGQPPSLVFVPSGCPFHPRCPFAQVPDPCASLRPELLTASSADHGAACHFAADMASVTPDSL